MAKRRKRAKRRRARPRARRNLVVDKARWARVVAFGGKSRPKKNALRFRDLPIGAWFEFYGWSVSFRGPYQKKSQRSFIDTKGKRKKVGSIDALVERASAPNPKRPARSNSRGVVVGDSALELRYRGGEGKRTRKMRGPWRHPFESSDVEILGNSDGSLSLRSKSGEKLWDYFEV